MKQISIWVGYFSTNNSYKFVSVISLNFLKLLCSIKSKTIAFAILLLTSLTVTANDSSDDSSGGTGGNTDPVATTTYCATEVTHFNIDGHPGSILLSVENSGADSMTVTATSPNDVIDLLIVEAIQGGGTAVTTVANGVATSEITWAAGTMPSTTSFMLQWSDVASPGGQMVNAGDGTDGLGNIDTTNDCPTDHPVPVPPVAPAKVNVTFQVDMSGVTTNAGGVSIAGGTVFGEVGQAMTEYDGEDIWILTTALNVNTRVLYKFRNQPNPGWSNLDDGAVLGAEGCGTGPYNDRFVDVGYTDLVIPVVAFSSCYAHQTISVLGEPNAVIGHKTSIDIAYDTTSNNNQLPGLGFRIHYNSQHLSFDRLFINIEQDLVVEEGPFVDNQDFDNNPNTDRFVTSAWASVSGNWPNVMLPAKLLSIQFDVLDTIETDTGTTTEITFSKISVSSGYEFQAINYEMDVLAATWDFDGNGRVDALTDGLILLRYTFGLTGEVLTKDVVATDSIYTPSQIEDQVIKALSIADIDNSGEIDALTDGLVLLRYMFGIRGEELISKVVAYGAERSESEEIGQYINKFIPKRTSMVNVTFQVDMSGVTTNAGGVSIAGGVFGVEGLLMTDVDGDDIWTLTTPLTSNTQVLYKFRNQPDADWNNLDDGGNLAAGGCGAGPYNDRFVDVGDTDLVIPVVAFSSCSANPVVETITYCATEVTHFNIDNHPGSILLSVENSGADSMTVTATSPNDVIDLLILATAIQGGGTASATTVANGVATFEITWAAGTMPATTSFGLLWSDEASGGNQMVNAGGGTDGLGNIDTSNVCPTDHPHPGTATCTALSPEC